jgi:hypothetical protein
MFREGAYLEQPQLPSLLGYEASGLLKRSARQSRISNRVTGSARSRRFP